MALSNFGGRGPVAAGSTDAITTFGAVDMAGNVREWCWNASALGRTLRGGAWSDQTYMFGNSPRRPPSTAPRETAFVASNTRKDGHLPEKLLAPYGIDEIRDFAPEKPVSDEVFAVFRRLFDYDARDLQARVEAETKAAGMDTGARFVHSRATATSA